MWWEVVRGLNGFAIFMIALVVVGLPVVLGVGSEVFKTWVRHRETMAGALAAQAAEKAAQDNARTERLEQGCGCWSGSSPTAAWRSMPRSSGCASRHRSTDDGAGR